MSVIYPHRVRVLFSFRRAFMSIILTIVCIVSLNMHYIIVQKHDSVSKNSAVSHCYDRLYFNPCHINVWPWIDMLVCFLFLVSSF